jgi:ubiquinone/menaquinone biosynthesis C-methylase UbiE
MFWDNVAGIYDLFADFFNGRVHKVLCREVADLILDDVLECACGTGMLTVHIAPRCHKVVATDFSHKMLQRAATKCRKFSNATFEFADILHLDYPDALFSKVVAANVIHLLDEPMKALAELDRVCKPGGQIIIPTYMNREKDGGKTSGFVKIVGKAGADFKRQFTFSSYQQFFAEAGYQNVTYKMIEGRVPCAVAVINK